MFNPLRLIRRKDYIDDAAAAYIEGRATEREQAMLRDRATREPDLFRDLDSLRDTVTLLRSVEPATAPRSFALAEAPVQVKIKRSRIAMAPAIFAIAAAAAVGLLAVGNLADIVHQSDGSSADEAGVSFSKNTSAQSTAAGGSQAESAIANDSPSGPQGPPGDAGAAGSTSLTGGSGTSDSSGARATVPAQTPLATVVASGMTSDLESATAPVAPNFDPAAEDDGGTTETVLPLIAPDQETSPGGDFATSGTGSVDDRSVTVGSGEPMLVPGSTATGLGPDSPGQPPGESSSVAMPSGSEPGGYELPIWQLQLAFAAVAVLMAGAWMLLQRRLTA